MKRVRSLLGLVTILLVAILLVGCKESKFYLDEKFYNTDNGLVIVELEDVNQAISQKESFIVYIYLTGCSTCQEFEPIVREFLEENKMMMYYLSYDKLEKGSYLKKKVKYAPSALIFEKGKLVDYLDTSSDRDTERYKSLDAFSEWMKSYIEMK